MLIRIRSTRYTQRQVHVRAYLKRSKRQRQRAGERQGQRNGHGLWKTTAGMDDFLVEHHWILVLFLFFFVGLLHCIQFGILFFGFIWKVPAWTLFGVSILFRWMVGVHDSISNFNAALSRPPSPFQFHGSKMFKLTIFEKYSQQIMSPLP